MHLDRHETAVFQGPFKRLLTGIFGDEVPVQAGGDGGRVAHDTGLQPVPVVQLPDGGPVFHGETRLTAGAAPVAFGGPRLDSRQDVRATLPMDAVKAKARVGSSIQAFPIDLADVALLPVVDHDLVTLSFFGAAKEQSRTDAPVGLDLQGDFKITEGPIGQQDASVAAPRGVLLAHDGSVFHAPAPSRAVTYLFGIGMPTLQVPPVEERLGSGLPGAGSALRFRLRLGRARSAGNRQRQRRRGHSPQ